MRSLAEIEAANKSAIRDSELRLEGQGDMARHLIDTANRHIEELKADIDVATDMVQRHADAGRTTLEGQTRAHVHCLKAQVQSNLDVIIFITKNAGDAINA